jgi:hypothetical protein
MLRCLSSRENVTSVPKIKLYKAEVTIDYWAEGIQEVEDGCNGDD